MLDELAESAEVEIRGLDADKEFDSPGEDLDVEEEILDIDDFLEDEDEPEDAAPLAAKPPPVPPALRPSGDELGEHTMSGAARHRRIRHGPGSIRGARRLRSQQSGRHPHGAGQLGGPTRAARKHGHGRRGIASAAARAS